ncbi:2TM domain-containing protein [Flavobacterium sp.]|uniref:2TM domain-containing protein n=1 Tax=Flavobacterium sp. TaxID=239 RepID=UPI003D6BF442
MEKGGKKEMQNEFEKIALKRVRKIRRFYTHLGIYSIGVVVFILKEYCNAPFNFPPIHYINWFLMTCWTFVLVVQGLKLFIREVVLGKDWENRQIDKILESEPKNINKK